MPMQFVCGACLEAGVRRELAPTDDYLLACSFCGAVDEKATYTSNAVEVSGAFGTLMDDAARNDARFRTLREKKHDVSYLQAVLMAGLCRVSAGGVPCGR